MTARKSSCVTTLAASGNVVYSFVSFRSKCDFHQTSCVMPRVPLASFSGLIVVSVLRCCAATEPWGRWVGKFTFHCHHVIGFSGLVDLWVIKIKSLWSFARVVRRDHVNRARNADHTARACEMFVYSIVKITRLYDYQTWQTLFEKFTRCAKVCGLYFSSFCFSGADWLGRQSPITWQTARWDAGMYNSLCILGSNSLICRTCK